MHTITNAVENGLSPQLQLCVLIATRSHFYALRTTNNNCYTDFHLEAALHITPLPSCLSVFGTEVGFGNRVTNNVLLSVEIAIER